MLTKNEVITENEKKALENSWKRKLDFIKPKKRGSLTVYFIAEIGLTRFSDSEKPYYITRFHYEDELGKQIGKTTYGRTHTQDIHELKRVVDYANTEFNYKFAACL
ncbi:hypothetical protein SAMN05216390_102338 [Lachnospiraceae bacterium KH1T2]|nr:hypothetical protein SAMN05216390_102338 [Lachnospiraceae bacterium KH1T2]